MALYFGLKHLPAGLKLEYQGSAIGLFPMELHQITGRFVSRSAAGPTSGGTISVSYNNYNDNTTIPTKVDGAANDPSQDLNWAVSNG
jgi:hypothetical protein